MALKRSATIPQTPAAASQESEPKETAIQDRSLPAEETPAAVADPEPEPSGQELARAASPLPVTTSPVNSDDDDGFGALDTKVGFGSFPIVKLDKDTFFMAEKKVGKEFYCVIMGAKPKTLYKEAGKQDTEFLFYSYDNVRDVSGRPVQDQLREWEAKGIRWETKEYMECVAREQVPTDKNLTDFTDGRVVLLNVPPASVARLAGYRLEAKAKGGMAHVITRCIAGDIVSVGKITFYPWNFEFVGEYAQG